MSALFNIPFLMKNIILGTFMLLVNHSICQKTISPESVVYNFFDAMNNVDVEVLDSIIYDEAVLSSSKLDKISLQGSIKQSTKLNFINAISTAPKGALDERIWDLKVEKRDGLANVWMDYAFYLNGNFSHCGVNNFTMMKIKDKWKVVSLSDTRKKENCEYDKQMKNVSKILDLWHDAAAKADSTQYFDLMTPNSIFIGTDKTEVWTKNQFLDFASPYFKKGKAWTFKATERNIYSEDFQELAWFDELLDTWMGPCRGSGVVVNINGKWYIQHYVLSVTVPNEDINTFLKIYEKEK